jgi:hypothetical protein
LSVDIYSELLLPNVQVSEQPRTHPLIAWERLREARRFIIWGLPGSGKTTALRRLFIEHRDASVAGQPDSVVPFYWQIRNWRGGDILQELVEGGRAQTTPIDVDKLYAAFSNGRAIVLLDAIDEVDPSRRAQLQESLREIAQVYPKLRLGMTCRHAIPAFISSEFMNFNLLPLNDQQIEELLLRQIDALKLPPEHSNNLVQMILNEPRIRELARSPLLLSALAQLYVYVGRLPLTKEQVLLAIVDVLLERWDSTRHIQRVYTSSDQLRDGIDRIAYYMLVRGLMSIDRSEVADLFEGSVPVDVLISEFMSLSLFKRNSKGNIEFPHAVLRDLCAARFAAQRPDVAKHLQMRADEWPDAASFLGQLIENRRARRPGQTRDAGRQRE